MASQNNDHDGVPSGGASRGEVNRPRNDKSSHRRLEEAREAKARRARRARRDAEHDEPLDPALGALIPLNTSITAIIAGYLGLFSILLFPAPLAIITGLIALWQIRRKPGLSGTSRAIFGIAMGILCPVILFALFMMGVR